MPWPMLHFSIGYELFKEPSPSFTLGSIAPDTVLVRESSRADKGMSHLSINDGEPASKQIMKDFFQYHYLRNNREEDKQFLFGYISHIYADIKWVYRKREAAQNYQALKGVLMEEENQVDFDLYRTVPWKEQLLLSIMQVKPYAIHGIYTHDELDTWRKQLFSWLDNKDNEPGIIPKYLTSYVVQEFIIETSKDLKVFFGELVEDGMK